MNRHLRALLLGTLLAITGSTPVLAGNAPEQIVGSWTLNLANSRFNPGPAPKSQIRTYAESADGISLTITGVAADGSPVAGKSTFKYDGKEYAISGQANFDSLSLKRVSANIVESTQKRGGKLMGTTVRTISADGKLLTLASKGTDAKGKPFENLMVFDRQ
jgi:hypothetical protein